MVGTATTCMPRSARRTAPRRWHCTLTGRYSFYNGKRVIYIGEDHRVRDLGRAGATGDDDTHQILDSDWTEVDSRQPVQFWGIQDRVTVYERG
jgi:hypothetical protein